MKKTLLAMGFALAINTGFAADLPNITILATGGTIAGTAGSSTQTTEYKSGQLAVQIGRIRVGLGTPLTY